MNKYFLVTVDTEGDNMWRKLYSKNAMKYRITTKNSEYLYRFQELCESYKLRPTYLVNYEMSVAKPFVEMARSGLERGTLEIGMHMHAWNCPPYYELSPSIWGGNPYIGEYPIHIMRKKVDYLTKQLQDVFQTDIHSHRSGRWYLDRRYLKILREYGYQADCSVTPGVDWGSNPGMTEGSKGTNYHKYPAESYEISLFKMNMRGRSGILEIPVSTYYDRKGELQWLRPTGTNLDEMRRLVLHKCKTGADYIEFMIHSSELMKKGSPNFETEEAIEKLYGDMDALFAYATKSYEGASVKDYVIQYKRRQSS